MPECPSRERAKAKMPARKKAKGIKVGKARMTGMPQKAKQVQREMDRQEEKARDRIGSLMQSGAG